MLKGFASLEANNPSPNQLKQTMKGPLKKLGGWDPGLPDHSLGPLTQILTYGWSTSLICGRWILFERATLYHTHKGENCSSIKEEIAPPIYSFIFMEELLHVQCLLNENLMLNYTLFSNIHRTLTIFPTNLSYRI